jgi:hypothetical protein
MFCWEQEKSYYGRYVMKSGVLLMLTAVIAFCVPFAAAQEAEVIHFQGTLTGPDGGPLPTDTYNVDFSIWDHATDGFQALWSETQTVEVNEGLFDVFLGGVNPLSPDIFTPEEDESELRFLEIQVEGDDPMTPRLQMGKMPNSFISSRILGDIETGLNSLLVKDVAGDSAIMLNADGNGSRMIIEDNLPADNRIAQIITDDVGSRLIIEDNMPDGNRAVQMSADDTGAQLIIEDNMPADEIGSRLIIDDGIPGDNRAAEISADDSGSRLIIEDNMPGPDRTVKIGADEDAASLSLHISDTEVPVMNLRGDILGASFEMSGYETGEQIGPLLGMNTDANGANFAMTAPGTGGLGADITDPMIEMITDASGGDFKINWTEPLDVPSPAIEMAVDNTAGSANFRLTQPLDVPAPAIEMNASNDLNGIFINWTQPLDIPSPAIEMMADGINNSFGINWTQPLDMPSPAIELSVDDVMSNFTINWAEPLDETPSPAIAMGCDMAGDASIVMFQPQPEPPGSDPIIEMLAGTNGGKFAMAAPSYGGLRTDIEAPIIEMATGIDPGGSIKMFQPQPEPPGLPAIELLSDDVSGRMNIFNDIYKYMGVEPSPFGPGGSLKMFDEVRGTAVEINSDGDVIGRRGSFGENHTVNGPAALVAGYGNTIGTAADYSCLVAVDGSLTADSTFMVDMPHIRFGDETDGYEFPTEDGRPNQMLATNGSGQLYWVDVTLLADENTDRLTEENRELKDMISRLERRIAELEKK